MRLYLFFWMLLAVLPCFAQNSLKTLPVISEEPPEMYLLPVGEDTVNDFFQASSALQWTCYPMPEHLPAFPGGIQQLLTYLQGNIRYPAMAIAAKVEGVVFVNFLVGPDGSISDVQVLKGVAYCCDEEAKRVVQEMPGWKPAILYGKPVAMRYSLPIRFKLDLPKKSRKRWLPFGRTFSR